MDKLKPTKVIKVNCPKCGELQLKIYPWASFNIPEGSPIPECKRCLKKKMLAVEKMKASKTIRNPF